MSTRCNIIIKETEGKFFQLYHHCDGYPDGVGLELEDYIKQMNPTCLTRGEDFVEFLCSEDDEYEYEGTTVSVHGDIEYLYIIDLSKHTLVCYSTWLTGAEDIDKLIINDKIETESTEATYVYMTKFKREMTEKSMDFEEFRNDILIALENKPKEWRDGQFVFNYIDECYPGLGRKVQFARGVDCFYNDNLIEDFILTAFQEYSESIKNGVIPE